MPSRGMRLAVKTRLIEPTQPRRRAFHSPEGPNLATKFHLLRLADGHRLSADRSRLYEFDSHQLAIGSRASC